MRPIVPVLVLPVLALLAGCSASSVTQADLEQQVSSQLARQVGQEPDSVDCPGDLAAEVGAETTCVLGAGGETIDVMVQVTSVEGDTVRFAIEVAQQVN
ncbi:DUF4333 domain-containing protein [Nocardioidaceae bacterium]|nr:DUF4333 domain-containing protein [Nocardioidaceae bacterium]